MADARAPKTPKDNAAAMVLLGQYHACAGELALSEANREAAIAATNAVADAIALRIFDRQNAIKAALAHWWAENAKQLTGGKRKSIELGGCIVGTKLSRAALEHDFSCDEAAVAALRAQRWAKPYVRVTYAVDRNKTIAGLAEGRHAEPLKTLGFKRRPGVDTFFIERVGQDGTISN